MSGGARARSGPAPDPASRTSLMRGRDFVQLPAHGWDGDEPELPLSRPTARERALWTRLWRKPQAMMWDHLGLFDQVAAYVRAYLESSGRNAPASLKNSVLRMETELGISVAGMRQNGWDIPGAVPVTDRSAAKRQTSSGDWLKAVQVREGS